MEVGVHEYINDPEHRSTVSLSCVLHTHSGAGEAATPPQSQPTAKKSAAKEATAKKKATTAKEKPAARDSEHSAFSNWVCRACSVLECNQIAVSFDHGVCAVCLSTARLL